MRSRRGRRKQVPRRDVGEEPAAPAPVWGRLQRDLGNRAVARMVQRLQGGPVDPSRPASIVARLRQGRRLEGEERTRMEQALGVELSDVRLHTDPEDAQLARDLSARAFTVGPHVAFAPGEYRPGTVEGDAILAHELAHTQQQADARPTDTGAAGQAAEHDANRSAAGAVARLWGQGTGFAQRLAAHARPRLRTGLALHRCVGGPKVEKREPPSYLGEHSREALRDIGDIERNLDIVSALIVFGVTSGTASPEGLAGEAAGTAATGESSFLEGMPSAMLDVFIIKGHLILQRIDFLRLDHGNDMNRQERAFWDRAYDRVSEVMGQASRRRRAR